jgi:hypothetical protein
MTHRPVVTTAFHEPFPVVVVKGEEAWVEMMDDPERVPPPPPGASYLVPPARVRSVERYLREHDTVHRKSAWVLRVTPLDAARQRTELFLMGDGYWGGVYEAAPSAVRPLYRKVTGPGFAFVFGPAAFALNCVAWGLVAAGARWYRRRAALPTPH